MLSSKLALTGMGARVDGAGLAGGPEDDNVVLAAGGGVLFGTLATVCSGCAALNGLPAGLEAAVIGGTFWKL